MITSQNIKKLVEENIDLCKAKVKNCFVFNERKINLCLQYFNFQKTLQKQVTDLQSSVKELNSKLSVKVNNDFS